MQLGALTDYPTQAAVRLLDFYATHLPAELPHVVARLEAAAGAGLGRLEYVTVPVNRDPRTGRYQPQSAAFRRRHGLGALGQEEEADTRAWWQRGLDAIGRLGSTALEIWGMYELREHSDKEERAAAERQYQAELEAARRQAELAAAQAAEAQARAEYQRQIAEIEAAQQAAKLKAFLPWIIGGVGLLGLWVVLRR